MTWYFLTKLDNCHIILINDAHIYRTNCIACVATIKWVYPFVGLVVDPLRSELSQLLVNIGTLRWVFGFKMLKELDYDNSVDFSILYVPNVKNLSWVIVTMRSEVWLTARITTISFSGICASFAIKSSPEMVCMIDIDIIRNTLSTT